MQPAHVCLPTRAAANTVVPVPGRIQTAGLLMLQCCVPGRPATMNQQEVLAACTPLVRAGSMRPLAAGPGSYGGPERAAEQTPHFNPARDGAESHSMQREASLQLQRSAILPCHCRKRGRRDLLPRGARWGTERLATMTARWLARPGQAWSQADQASPDQYQDIDHTSRLEAGA